MQTIAGTTLYDYGARFYNPRTGMWLTRDPLADDYKEYSPYVFCAGNPVNVVDPDGESTYVRMISPECYRVIDGGDPEDGDDNIYVVYYDANGAAHPDYSIGTTGTPYSFYDSSESGWKAIHAYIDLTDESAFRFTDYFVDNDISLFDYIRKARNYGLFDFKETNFDENEVGIHHSQLHQYRGMPISRGGKPIIASARDVGNIVAGYMSAVNHIPYFLHRLACDYYQSISGDKGGWTVVGPITHDMTFKWDFEGPESTVAQRLGWEIGRNKKRK